VWLPELSPAEHFALERLLLVVSPEGHLMKLHRARLESQRVLSSAELQGRHNGERVRVAGQLALLQAPPAAKGVHFLSFEDE